MDADLSKLRIDTHRKQSRDEGSSRALRWIVGVLLGLVLLGGSSWAWTIWTAATPVRVERVRNSNTGGDAPQGEVILNATGYIIAAHKIQVASKVVGRVSWIGVEKGDRVQKGQAIVRLEDDEYRAQLQQAQGRLAQLQAMLQELENGSRPEEIAVAKANVDQARAELRREELNLARIRQLVEEGVFSKQQLDDAVSAHLSNQARVEALEKNFRLVEIGPRVERLDAVRGQILEAKGAVAFYETQLANTVIRAPVDGTILERNVETGEFVTTGFVGDRGAKGYVVSMADLNDLQVELDISQNDFAKLGPKQKGTVTADAYPDRRYEGAIHEISPEANRQKATVQVKVQVANPDGYLRPDMNASVAFISDAPAKPSGDTAGKPLIYVPATAVRNGKVFLVLEGRAVAREVVVGSSTNQGLRIDSGLIGGEDLIVNPTDDLKDGDRVKAG